MPDDIPPGHHPATPRFLVSLLATAVYLSIPTIASQALNAILSSVGPYTVIQYLNFSLGQAIEKESSEEPEAAVGLEYIAQRIQERQEYFNCAPEPDAMQECIGRELQQALDIKKEITSDVSSQLRSSSSSSSDGRNAQPPFHYGAISDKIGEAAACWLARWAPDMLFYEQQSAIDGNLPTMPVQPPHDRSFEGPGYNGKSSNSRSSSTSVIPVIFARGGLKAEWVSALVGSDVLFVKGERERYDFARSVVELRRKDGLVDEEEEEWEKMFSQCIYYTNMVRTVDSLETFY
jgi:hypothetical protein